MSGIEIHPVIPLLIGAALMPVLNPGARRWLALVASGAALAVLVGLPVDWRQTVAMLGQELTVARVDMLGRVFALAFSIYAVIASVYAWEETGPAPKAFSLALAAGGIGVVLAGDLLTLFFFWELLTVSSLFLIWQGGSRQALAAGSRYLLLHLAGGICLLMGILLHWQATGALTFETMRLEGMSSWLMAIGMLTNAAVPPLHAWLPDAYPRATIFGTVFLSAFTTKAAVYALARAFPQSEALIWLGALMALYGVVFAVLENDIRRLLGYHIISQVGYMVCGVGLGTALAINGASAHAFAHIFYKGLLMMSAGAVIYATGRGKLTELGGLARPMFATFIFMMIGAFSISGVPLFNGFVSKALVISAAAYEYRPPVEMMLLIASMGTFLHTGLKLPWFTFFGTVQGAAVERRVPMSMYVAMGSAAVICIVTGIFPNLIYRLLPMEMEYHPYTPDHVVGGIQILVGTALGFWLLRGKLGGEPTVTLDVDHLYRRPIWLAVSSSAAAVETGGRVAAASRQRLGAAIAALFLPLLRQRSPLLSTQVLVVMAVLVALAGMLIVGYAVVAGS
jgi:multicomponent Na+:H+ antiporter subunit D